MSAITINQLHFAYSDTPVLQIESFDMALGERVFLSGPSGCGKSTLLNLLSGTLAQSDPRDSIQVLGQSLQVLTARESDQFRARNMGIVFQQFNLIGYLTVAQNIALSTEFHSCDKRQLLAQIPMLLNQLNLPEHILNQTANSLSVGQQQRVAIARAMIHQPKLLIVDEPTSALDEATTDGFMDTLISMSDAAQMSVLFVSHDQRLARYFSRHVALNDINKGGSVCV